MAIIIINETEEVNKYEHQKNTIQDFRIILVIIILVINFFETYIRFR